MQQPIWRYDWRSNKQQDRYCFWHAHFAGGDGNGRVDCSEQLLRNEAASPVAALWRHLSVGILKGHEPLRVYAKTPTRGQV